MTNEQSASGQENKTFFERGVAGYNKNCQTEPVEAGMFE